MEVPFRCSTHFINQALLSGEFLEYDVKSGTYRNSLISSALFDLRGNIERLCHARESTRDMLIRFELKYRHLAQTEEDVKMSRFSLRSS